MVKNAEVLVQVEMQNHAVEMVDVMMVGMEMEDVLVIKDIMD